MDTLIKGIILILFACVVFFKDYYPSDILYWLTYVVMFVLIPLWWRAAYWVSEKIAKDTLKEDFDASFFVGMVAINPSDDLIRGRLCITKSELKLVVKDHSSYKILWIEKRANINSIGYGKVAGARKGFTIYTKDSEVSFAINKAEEVGKVLTK